MKALLARLLGADRPKVIGVFGVTRAEVERGVRYAQTAAANLPIWAWCAEELAEDAQPIAGCDRLTTGVSALSLRKDLGEVWPALLIVAWTGRHAGTPSCTFAKLMPLSVPPFRVLLFNEAQGFFAARLGPIASHLKRRARDAAVAGGRRAAECGWSILWRTGERIRDGFKWIWSLLWRTGEYVRDAFNWIREALFAVLAFLALCTSPLSHAVVMGLRRRRPGKVPFEKAIDDSLVEVAIPNRGWPYQAVAQALTQSTAEFVVLRMRGEFNSPAPLIALARETNAFAVAKQSAHSAWRRRTVCRHPFRRLQLGEVSEVFAPFSSLLVLRRETVLRLGVPRALTFGGALTLLFWKASAAGLRSLVAGHSDPITDEPAMALEDAELALRLTLSPSLAALGPARPARFRGNVAWSPFSQAMCRSGGGKLRVLVVSPYLPFPLSHGGAVRIYNLCRALAHQVDFVLACFREANETVRYDELHQVFREVYIVDSDEKHRRFDVPERVAEYRNSAMSDLVRNFCTERRVDLVQLEYTQMAEYREDTGAIPVVLVEHDVTFTLYRQLAERNRAVETRREYHRWLEFERAALQCSNRVWTVSDEDRATAIDYGAVWRRTDVIPNGVDLNRFTPAPKSAGPPVVLFVGSFRHLPNLLAFEALRDLIMPAVWNECPSAILHVIAGPHHERAADLAGKAALLKPDARIVIEGFVEDVRPAYRGSDVVAIPLPVSAGTNIKVLEAMACGRAIVSTPAGCQGLDLVDGRELIVAELGALFSSALVSVLCNHDVQSGIALQARRTVERRFGWETIARQALVSYSALTEKTITSAVG